MPPSKAHGVDALGPRYLHRLPEPAVEAYADILNSVEHAGIWPLQISGTIAALAAKKSGGDR
eukprot:6780043-Pyramimonas_sp.AAC.1